jgi:hypothetical protein
MVTIPFRDELGRVAPENVLIVAYGQAFSGVLHLEIVDFGPH